MKDIYILLSQTQTYPARIIRMYTREPYAHASIAFDSELQEMYSFARRSRYNVLTAGFIEEDIEKGIFGLYPDTNCCLYKLSVLEDQWERLKEEIEIFKENREKYTYNFLGILGVMVNIPVERKYKYFCSQFVAYMLLNAGIDLFYKAPSLVRPYDFRNHPDLVVVYEGLLSEYRASISV